MGTKWKIDSVTPPGPLKPVPLSHPSSAHWEARRLQGSTGNWGSRSFGSPGRFSVLLCVSPLASACSRVYYQQRQKGPRWQEAGWGSGCWPFSPGGLSANSPLAAVPEEGAGWEGPHSPNTGPWRSSCVSITAALAGGTALGR